MPRHINRIVLLSFILYLVSILTVPSMLGDHLASAAASENQLLPIHSHTKYVYDVR